MYVGSPIGAPYFSLLCERGRSWSKCYTDYTLGLLRALLTQQLSIAFLTGNPVTNWTKLEAEMGIVLQNLKRLLPLIFSAVKS